MTVDQLIGKLLEQPGDRQVFIEVYECGTHHFLPLYTTHVEWENSVYEGWAADRLGFGQS